MARSRKSDVVYIGVGSHIVALQASSGIELWRTKLKRSSFVTIHRDGEKLFAGSGGELYCIEPVSGEIVWHNKLKGLGLGLIAFPGASEIAMQMQGEASRGGSAATISAAT